MIQDSFFIYLFIHLLQIIKKEGVASHLDGGPRCATEIGSTSQDVGKRVAGGGGRNSEVGRTPPPMFPPFDAQRRSLSLCILECVFNRLVGSTGSVDGYIEEKRMGGGATPTDSRHSKYENL